ncbi:hypothetical protein STEG23_013015, partial [Scotinomys teguina]
VIDGAVGLHSSSGAYEESSSYFLSLSGSPTYTSCLAFGYSAFYSTSHSNTPSPSVHIPHRDFQIGKWEQESPDLRSLPE